VGLPLPDHEERTMNDYHAEHALEAALERRLARVRQHEADVRRLEQERWQRRILPLLSNDTPIPTDFDGCVG
jgi:hypothetical protein